MVKKLYKFFGYSLVFILALMYFVPKVSLYYFLETKLDQFAVVISSEEVLDKGFTLKIKHADLYYKSIQSANIQESNIKLFVLYNAVDFQNITLSSAAKFFVPLHVKNINIKYTMFDPLYIKADVEGEFGKANVRFSIFDKTLHLKLLPSELMLKSYVNTLKNMSKNEKGEYIYDKTIKL
ncbi:hypothetical protein [Sulfurimonas sp. CS5]|uniref:hypothetical protein n=1 Tax=Sulfurimonas sp. CS5 TaxID=3391145 RepID=UPI0039E9ADD7